MRHSLCWKNTGDIFVITAGVQVHTDAEYLEMLDAKGYLRSKFVHSDCTDTIRTVWFWFQTRYFDTHDRLHCTHFENHRVGVSQIGSLEHLTSNKNIDIQAETIDKPLPFAKRKAPSTKSSWSPLRIQFAVAIDKRRTDKWSDAKLNQDLARLHRSCKPKSFVNISWSSQIQLPSYARLKQKCSYTKKTWASSTCQGCFTVVNKHRHTHGGYWYY